MTNLQRHYDIVDTFCLVRNPRQLVREEVKLAEQWLWCLAKIARFWAKIEGWHYFDEEATR